MDREDFIKETESYTVSELEYIYNTQKELYSEEELEIIKDTLEKKKLIDYDVSHKSSYNGKLTADYFFFVTLMCIIALIFPTANLFTGGAMLLTGLMKKGSPEWKSAGIKVLIAAVIGLLIRAFLTNGGFHV